MLSTLLTGEFLTRERVRLWSAGLIVATVLAVAFLALTSHGLADYKGRPLGTDFSCFYAAGDLARQGHAADAYDMALLNKAQRSLFGPSAPVYGWFYPPQFLFVAQALSHLHYIPALMLWQGLSLALYLLALWQLLRSAPHLARDPLWLLVALGFPAVFVNLTHGQNGFLSAALMAGGLAFLKPKPIIAGILFGLLAYKPQLGLALPIALLAGREWRAFSAAVCTVLVTAALATAFYGADIWSAFLGAMQISRASVIELGSIGYDKFQSLFGAVRLLDGSVAWAYAAQGLVTIAILAALVRVWRGSASPAVKGAALCIAALLSTPYCLDYDLMLLAPAIALVASEGRVCGFRRGELLILAALWLLPAVAREFASATHLALAPLVMGLGFVLVLRRA